MKFFVALSITLVMLLRPLWPIVNYVANYDYIVENFCENINKPQLKCNGQCYLMKQLAKQTSEEKSNPFEKGKKSESSEIVYFEKYQYQIPWIIQGAPIEEVLYSFNLSLNEFSSIFLPPPQV